MSRQIILLWQVPGVLPKGRCMVKFWNCQSHSGISGFQNVIEWLLYILILVYMVVSFMALMAATTTSIIDVRVCISCIISIYSN